MVASATLADIARIALGLAVVLAAVAKIASGSTWAEQAGAAGVSRSVAGTVPWIELVVGAAVIAGVAEPVPVVAAIVLLGAFTAWIVGQLAHGRHPPCACFGSLSAAPLSWWHVARNGGLLALGVLSLIL